MVYYLNDIEHKQLLKKFRPLSRRVGVTEELRGWSWDNSPMKPYHDIKLPMYSICSKYCPIQRCLKQPAVFHRGKMIATSVPFLI